MLKKIYANGSNEVELIKGMSKRGVAANKEVADIVSAIIDDIRDNGDEALEKYTLKFDKKLPEYFEVPREVINNALTDADEEFVNAVLNAQENIAEFHNRQKEQSFIDAKANGVILGQKLRGLKRVGLYVPGGTAPLFSSVLMNAIPAKIAGVEEIVMVTPPQKDGTPNKEMLIAAAICGVDRVFLAGGAQAVAALAFGTETIPKCDKIVGPGNIFVTTAKKLLYGTVDIDMIAGPSEILVLCDSTANAKYVAADLLSQAEHDILASSILVTTDEKLADDVISEVEIQLDKLPRKDIARKSIDDFGAVIVCKDLQQAIDTANYIAPEHLEVQTANPLELLGCLDNAGSIFLGQYAPEALGDYYAGPNHVLPTSGTARFYSPLSVYDFVKRSSYIYYTREALENAKDDIILMAEKEGLGAHANSVRIRFED